MSTRTCPKCGMQIPFSATTCPYCHCDPRHTMEKVADGATNLIMKIVKWLFIIIVIISIIITLFS